MNTTSQLHIWTNKDDRRRCINCDTLWHPTKEKTLCTTNKLTLKDIENVDYN